MKKVFLWLFGFTFLLVTSCAHPTLTDFQTSTPPPTTSETTIKLPEPGQKGDMSVEEALLQRRSIREYIEAPLTISEVSQLLWSAQGITAEWGARTAPSAGALYPLEVYLVAGNVDGLTSGIYKYQPQGHELVIVIDGDLRAELSQAALSQLSVKEGAIDIVIAGVYEKTTKKYDDRGIRYVHMEAGHAAQNIYLQATALNLGTVTVGAFDDEQVKQVMGMPENESPLYIMPVGKKP